MEEVDECMNENVKKKLRNESEKGNVDYDGERRVKAEMEG